LPFEFVSVADQFRTRIGELAVAGQSVGVDSLAAHADALKAAAQRLEETTKHWNDRYRADSATDDAPAIALNACIKRLSRLLLPITSTRRAPTGTTRSRIRRSQR